MTEHCGAKTRSGAPCRNEPGWGTDHFGFGRCRKHGGNTPNGRAHAAKVEANQAAADAGLRAAAIEDPHEALAVLMQLAGAQLDLARRKVEAFGDELLADGDASAWSRYFDGALDRMARIAKMAADADVGERRVRLAEASADLWAPVLAGILEDLELTDEQRERAPGIVEARLAALERRTGRAAAAVEGSVVEGSVVELGEGS